MLRDLLIILPVTKFVISGTGRSPIRDLTYLKDWTDSFDSRFCKGTR